MKRLVNFFAERSLIVNLITVGILISGVMFMFSANREAFPRVEYDFVLITTMYPGATAADIEKHVSIPVENEMREVDGIDEVTSSSTESRSIVAVKIDPDVDNKEKVINDIRNAVDKVTDMPDDAEDPEVTELKSSLMPIVEVSVIRKKGITNDNDERELRKRAKAMEDDLLELGGVARVDKQGYRDREMMVEVDPRKLEKFHIGVNDVIFALKQRNLNFPAGLVQTGNEEVMVRTIGEVESVDDLEKVVIKANDLGFWVRIGDVARVKDTYDEMTILNKHTGRQAVTLTVIKKESADIIDTVNDVENLVKQARKIHGDSYEYHLTNDFSYYVKRRLNVLVNNGIVGLILVSLSLFLTLGWRISLVTVIGIPVAFAGTFIWMGQAGVTLNLMSLFGLILVLGMVVDDAIIVAENIYRRLEEGESPAQAVKNGAGEVVVPVMGTILTTIAAFSPLMFMSGIMGKFVWTLPAVVSVSLIASWVESMFILPAHVSDLEKRRKVAVSSSRGIQENRGIFRTIQKTYMSALEFVLLNKYKFFLLITAVFIGTVGFAVKNIDFKLFPQDKIERFVVKMEAAKGTNLEAMNSKISLFEKMIDRLPKTEVESYISQVGIIREGPMDPGAKYDSNYAYIMVNLTPEENRKRKANEIIMDLRSKAKTIIAKNFVKVEINVQKNGPPTGKPVSILLKGDDFTVLRKVSAEYQDYMKTIKGLKDVQDTYEEGKDELRIFVNQKTAGIAGINVYDVATTVRTCFKGTVATEIKKSDEEIEIRVIYPERLRNDLDSINSINITNKMGNLVPLSELAYFKKAVGISKIDREDWKRSIRVTAEIDENAQGVSSVAVNSELMKKFANIRERYPDVIVDYSGEWKDTQESVQQLLRSFIIAVLVIYIILVALFNSLVHPLIIISIIPLTFVGVIWAFYIHGMVFSFLALMGIVGLAGVIVNDSIVLVDFIKNNRVKGMGPLEACIDAGAKRIRPVFLTTITTFLGLIPTAYGWGGYDPFLKPMAVSMSWGLLVGTMVTLVGTPMVYMLFVDIRRKVTGRVRTAEDFIHHSIQEEEQEVMKECICNEVLEQVDEKLDHMATKMEEGMVKKYGLKKKPASRKKTK